MPTTYYRNNSLHIEEIDLNKVVKLYGTPCYVYSKAAILSNLQAFESAFNHPHRICYAVKANSNLSLLKLLVEYQVGFDIVSQGELERVIAAGGKPEQIVFSGVGKSQQEIMYALKLGIGCFNVESHAELIRINAIAKQLGKIAPIALRINPNIDAGTHPYISTGLKENKFGIDYQEALPIIETLSSYPAVQLIGIGCHIGSQITELAPFSLVIDRLIEMVEYLSTLNIHLKFLNVGGGLGICYQQESPPSIHEYVSMITNKLKRFSAQIIIEPGRAMVANTGILLTTVEYIKQTAHKNFLIVDAGMNDLMRPALYDAWHTIVPLNQTSPATQDQYDIVGPVCESADFLGKNRTIHAEAGDVLAVLATGAYGYSMSSNYNSRLRCPEVLIDGEQIQLIRKRETYADLFALEII